MSDEPEMPQPGQALVNRDGVLELMQVVTCEACGGMGGVLEQVTSEGAFDLRTCPVCRIAGQWLRPLAAASEGSPQP